MPSRRHRQKRQRSRKRRHSRRMHGGAVEGDVIPPSTPSQNSQLIGRDGVLDMVGKRVMEVLQIAGQSVFDAAIRVMGLQRVPTNVSPALDELKRTASSQLNDTMGKINEILASPAVEKAVSGAAEKTALITELLLTKMNQILGNPKVRALVEKAMTELEVYGYLVVKHMRGPLDKLLDELQQKAPKIASIAADNMVKAGVSAVAAVPFLGTPINLGNAANNLSKVFASGTEAASLATDASTHFVEAIKKEIDSAKAVEDRTKQSINAFESPKLPTTDYYYPKLSTTSNPIYNQQSTQIS